MENVAILIGMLGIIGFFVFAIMLIVSVFRKRPKKKKLIGLAVCTILFVAGAALTPESDKPVNEGTHIESLEKEQEQQEAETEEPTAAPTPTPEPTPTPTPAPTVTPEPSPEPEFDVEVTATVLLNAYDTNQIGAEKEYDGKTLKVTGTVRSIDRDIFNQPYITFENSDNQYSLISVQCYFSSDDEVDKIAELSPGDTVSVIGKCDGKTLNVVLRKCTMQG